MEKPIVKLEWIIPNEWDFISHTSASVLHILNYFFRDQDLADRVDMVLHELLENVLKYHRWDEGLPAPMFRMMMSPDQKKMIFQIANAIDVGGEHHQAVDTAMNRLRNAKTPSDACLERMVEDGMNPDGHSRLGLYRIASAGLCQVDAQVDGNSILQITATMLVDGQGIQHAYV